MKERKGLGPLELVVITMVAVVIGLLAKGCNAQKDNAPTPTPTGVCQTYEHITYCRQPASPTLR